MSKMLEDNRTYKSAESDDLPSVRRPHRSRVNKSETSGDMDRRHHRRRRHRDEGTVLEDNHASYESHSHRRRSRHTRESSSVGYEDADLNKPRDKEHSGRVRRRSSVSSTTRPSRDSISERVRTSGSQISERSRRKRSYKTTRSASSSASSDSEDPKGQSKVREKTASIHITRPRHSSSVKEKSTRPGLVRSSTSVRNSVKTSSLPTVKEEPKVQIHRPVQRSLSVFGNLFGPPRPSAPEEKVSCLICLDDIAASKAPMLVCGHRMCYSCLKRIFTLSVTDPAHMPPKCCTDECIPLKHVQKLFDDKFKIRWNRKYHEYTTKNRIYCPAKGCGSWIPPKDITRDKDGGRKYGTCRKCKTQVCAACNGKRHKSKECPQDDSTQQFADMAKDNGWQKCYNCSATVELKEGCNHMTCRCTAQFCMICGAKWKTCNCPWFNYAADNDGFVNHMNIYQVRAEIARGGEAYAQPRAFTEELEQRREQIRQDEVIARRLQGMDNEFDLPRGGWAGIMADRAGPFLDTDYVQRATDILSAGIDGAQQPTADNMVQSPQGQTRVIGAAAAFRRPARHLSTRQTSNTVTRATLPAIQRRPSDIPFRLPPPPPPPPEPTPRRSATIRSSRPAQEAEDTDSTDESIEEPIKRPALLAGLNRASDTSRVNAWRQHVTGEPEVKPF